MSDNSEFTITKKISSMGENNILIIPKVLREQLSPGTVVQANIKILSKPQTKPKKNIFDKKKNISKEESQVQQKTKNTDSSLVKIIKSLLDKGYNPQQIETVLIKNGYKKKDILVVLKELT